MRKITAFLLSYFLTFSAFATGVEGPVNGSRTPNVANATGTLPVANGGTNVTSATDDSLLVGNGTTFQLKAVATCTDTGGNHLNYDASTNTFSCGTSGSGGTPGGSNTQVQFNNSSAFGGDAGFVFVAASDTLTVGEVGTAGVIAGADNGAGAGVALTVRGGAGNGASAGGATTVQGGAGGATGTGASAFLVGGSGGATSGTGGTAQVRGGLTTDGDGGAVNLEGRGATGTNRNGGNVTIVAGLKTGSGTNGVINLQVQSGTTKAQIDGNGNLIYKQALADQSYSYQQPTTGFTITIGDNTSQLILDPAGTLATGTITMPATPIDGQRVCVSDTQVQTALTVSPNSGQSIKNAPTSLTAGGKFCYIYRATNTTWYVL